MPSYAVPLKDPLEAPTVWVLPVEPVATGTVRSPTLLPIIIQYNLLKDLMKVGVFF